MTRTCLMATMRDEAPFLLEWVAHNKAAGFDRIAVASNDCTDGTEGMLDRLAQLGVIDHLRHLPPYAPFSIKMAAYARLRVQPGVATAEWLLALDADEYLRVRTGDGTVGALLDRLAGAEAVVIPRRLAAGDGRLPRRVLTPDLCLNRRPGGAKVLCRVHTRFPIYAAWGPALPAETPARARFDVRSVTAAGVALPPRVLTSASDPARLGDPGGDWQGAEITHAAALTPALFVLKRLKGHAGKREPDQPRSVSRYGWLRRQPGRSARPDPAPDPLAQTRVAWLGRLLSDPDLATMHHAARRELAAKIEAVRKTPEHAALTRLGALRHELSRGLNR